MKSKEQLHAENDWIMATIEVHWPPFAELFIYVLARFVWLVLVREKRIIHVCVCAARLYIVLISLYGMNLFQFLHMYLFIHNDTFIVSNAYVYKH